MTTATGADATGLTLLRAQHSPGAPEPPWLSVVVCAYRHAAYIDECLASVNATPPGTSLELIVIDDGSPDDTLARCLAFAFRADLRLRVYGKRNQGLVHSLRSALDVATGRYFAVMASDDAYAAGGLEQVLSALAIDSAPPGAMLCQAMYFGDRAGARVYGEAHHALFRGSAAARMEAVCTEYPKPLLLQASVFETRWLREFGIWKDGLELDDWPTFVRLFTAEAERRATVRFRPDIVLCRYRQHAGGAHNRLDRQLRICEQVARQLVPLRWRAVCLANVRIDIGLIHLYGGNRAKGLWLCLRGLLTAPTPRVVSGVWRRGVAAVTRRVRARAVPG